MSLIKQVFASDGAFAEAIEGYKPREPQIALSTAIEQSFKNAETLIAEAGTGTGKTFAYLVPALLAKGKTIISTGTKNLQEQLYLKDLPLVKNAIDKTRKTALLKGRSNYLCIYRLSLNGGEHMRLDKQTLHQYQQVQRWSSTTSTGDMAEMHSLPEGASVIPLVTSTVDNCLGKDCKHYEDCYLFKARQNAMKADVVVVNHHLFFADLSLKQDGFGELIPEVQQVIFDEAHLLPDIASEYFGKSFSTRQLSDLLNDIQKIQKTAMKDAGQVSELADKVSLMVQDFRLLFGVDAHKGELDLKLQEPKIDLQAKKLVENIQRLHAACELHLSRESDFDRCVERLDEMTERLVDICAFQQTDVSMWYETTKRHLIMHITPLDISSQFNRIVESSQAAWVFTSATLSVGKSFEHYQNALGLKNAKSILFDSPFNYQEQSLLCIPRYLPAPSNRKIKQHLTDLALNLIDYSDGSVFFLFTSHYMMREVALAVSEASDYEVLVQGDASKQSLLKQFVSKKEAVLFATGAFWEGVDVKGTALQCVVIDKLPFSSPDDPLLKARVKDLRSKGGDPFSQIQIPQAVIALKQGAGRLIRDFDDKGVLIICDNRLVNKKYGQTFLTSLPNMSKTRDMNNVKKFLAKLR